jgi:Na+-driven multidrug efflux pump
MGIEGLGVVIMHALLGAGDARRVMMVAVLAQWVVFLPLAWLAGPMLGFGLTTIWLLYGGYRAGMAAVFTRHWIRGHWRHITV